MKDALQAMQDHGQCVWLEDLSRGLMISGELKHLIEEVGLRGLTSNPATFERAIAGSPDYRDWLEAPETQGIEAKTLYERLAVRDVQEAADLFDPLYRESMRRDGYVSLEVSPELAHSSQGTLDEARHLWGLVARPNLMIKIPGTPEALPAIQELISEGINVNVTLLFSQEAYESAALAYFTGLERFSLKGGDLSTVTSVASFFLSRMDTAVDKLILDRLKTSRFPKEQAALRSLMGNVAIASAKSTYQRQLELFSGDRWQALSHQGAHTQRLVWAGTSTSNPNHSDVHYVEQLIGPNTVVALLPLTLESFRDHGHVHTTLLEGIEEARHTMELIEQVGIPIKELTEKVLADSLKELAAAFVNLLKTTNRSSKASTSDPVTFLRIKLFKEFYKGRQRG